jgi:hypothetical protein
MAEIWPLYDGNTPAGRGPWARLSLSEAVRLFELKHRDLISDVNPTPRFGPQDRDLWFAGFKHVAVRIAPEEARQSAWKPGYYKSRIRPKEAFGRLIRHALVPALGEKNVLRVAWEPTIDSQGDAAFNITVVVPPEATRRLTGQHVIDASIALRSRLPEIFEDSVPIIQYTTEAELSQVAGP